MTLEQIIKQLKIILAQFRVLVLNSKLTIPNLKNPTKILIHHGGGFLDFDGVNRYHQMRWGFKSSLGYYIGYTWFIERSGKLIQGRADNEEGAHTKGYNKRTIGIGLMGNGEEKDFTKEQYETLKKLTDKKIKQYKIPHSEVYGHRNFAFTACPSDVLYNWLIKYKNAGE